ncbi:MAG: hypothetical protein ACR2H0_03820 [Candidatus Limnocylindrales bacterium]
MDGFRGAVMASGSSAVFGGLAGLAGWSSKRGNSPTPFDAVDGSRLAGPQGSHPLAAVSIEEMLKPRSDGLDGAIEIKHPVRIGEAIEGHIKLTALRDIAARRAMLRLVGAVITEQRESKEDRDNQGKVTRSEQWVEVHGKLFEELPFTQPGPRSTRRRFARARPSACRSRRTRHPPSRRRESVLATAYGHWLIASCAQTWPWNAPSR